MSGSVSLRFLKQTAGTLARKKFKSNKSFSVEIDGAPADIDFHVMDMTHCIVEIETAQKKIGMKRINLPEASQQVDITLTIRDDQHETFRKFFIDWSNLIDNGDGTSNPPSHYLKKVRRFKHVSSSNESGFFLTESNYKDLQKKHSTPGTAPNKVETEEWDMFVTKIGDQSESVEESGHHTYPVILTGFRS